MPSFQLKSKNLIQEVRIRLFLDRKKLAMILQVLWAITVYLKSDKYDFHYNLQIFLPYAQFILLKKPQKE